MSQILHFDIRHLDDLQIVADQLIPHLLTHRTATLVGDLGAGKTTLVNVICERLGVSELVSSPTFSIVNEYQAKDVEIIHMDLYRIERTEELYDMGFEEYLDRNAVVFIEWPDIAGSLIPSSAIGIHIELYDNSSRRVKLNIP